MILEVIVTSVADAIAAERGGATRLEVISHFEQAGLTPSLALVEGILSAVRIPIRVMLRERNDFDVRDEAELARHCDAARALSRVCVDGLVLGFLRDGDVEVRMMARILASAPNCKATFHRAVEAVQDLDSALVEIMSLPQVDCILTSGGTGRWPDRARQLASVQAHCGPTLRVLVGGGVTAEAIAAVCSATDIRAFHLGRAVREPQTIDGVVKPERVADFRARIASFPLPRANSAPMPATDHPGC